MDWLKGHEYLATWIAALAGVISIIPWEKVSAAGRAIAGSASETESQRKRRRRKIFVWTVWAVELVLLFFPHDDPKAKYVALFMVVIIPITEYLDSRIKPPSQGTP